MPKWRHRNPAGLDMGWEGHEAQARSNGEIIATLSSANHVSVHALCTCTPDIIGHHVRLNADDTVELASAERAAYFDWQDENHVDDDDTDED